MRLEFFGCVPAELWWDNPTTVATAIRRGRDRRLNPYYASLASHYRFAPMFCMPARGQEKGDAERTVLALQRRFATPVPCVPNLDAINRHLLGCCLKERQRTVVGRSETIGQMFEAERRCAVELPARPFDACVQHVRQADKYQTVLFEDVHYSVPRQVAFEPVTVKAYLGEVVLVHKGQVVAGTGGAAAGEQVLEPTHFLSVRGRKPAYLDQTKLFKDLRLPAAFGQLRRAAEPGNSAHAPAPATTSASCSCSAATPPRWSPGRSGVPAPPGVRTRSSSRSCEPSSATTARDHPVVHRVHVPPPDVRRFDRLLIHHPVPQPPEGDREHDQPSADLLLRHNLKALRLPTMLAEYAKLSREAADADEGYDRVPAAADGAGVGHPACERAGDAGEGRRVPVHEGAGDFDFSVTRA